MNPRKRILRASSARLLALPLLAMLAGPGCGATTEAIIGAAINTGIAVGVAAANRAGGGCYSPCDHGNVCNPETGLCEPVPCGGCEDNERCDETLSPPKCIPVLMDDMQIIGSLGPPREDGAEEYAATPTAPPAEQTGCVRISHAYPAWPAPADYQPTEPTFFIRFNQPVNPQQAVDQARIVTDDSGWQSGRFILRDSFLVTCTQGTCTDVFFGLNEPLEPGTLATWAVHGADEDALGKVCPGSAQNGAYVYTVFRTHDDMHAIGALDSFWNQEQLVRTYGRAEAEALLQNQTEATGILRRYEARKAKRAAEAKTTPSEGE